MVMLWWLMGVRVSAHVHTTSSVYHMFFLIMAAGEKKYH